MRFWKNLRWKCWRTFSAESSSAPARNKIRAYLQKWRPLRMDLQSAANELENIGMARGPKFDKVVEDFFGAQLAGRAKTPEDRTKLLRKLSGIKEPPPKKIKEVKKKGSPEAKAEELEAKNAATAKFTAKLNSGKAFGRYAEAWLASGSASQARCGKSTGGTHKPARRRANRRRSTQSRRRKRSAELPPALYRAFTPERQRFSQNKFQFAAAGKAERAGLE